MIYTVTFNPAVDYVVLTDEIQVGRTNRASGETIRFGGKGINVSVVLKELDIPSKALGFIAGFTGDAIERGIAGQGIETDFIRLDQGFSRINVKIRSRSETELNGRGPHIDSGSLNAFFAKLDALTRGDIIVLAGSIPPDMPADTYEKILERLSGKQVRAVVDATKDLLLNTLPYRPFLIKPNREELEEICGSALRTTEEIAGHAARLQEMGARNVLVSMAGDGALLLDENGKLHTCGACRGTVKNSVGAGDSMVAGFIAGSLEGDYAYALKLGTAAGGATAFCDGLARKDDIFSLLQQL